MYLYDVSKLLLFSRRYAPGRMLLPPYYDALVTKTARKAVNLFLKSSLDRHNFAVQYSPYHRNSLRLYANVIFAFQRGGK